MKTTKQVLKIALVVSILSFGAAPLLLLSTTHGALAQIKSQQNMTMARNNMTSMMKDGMQQPGMHTGSMKTNMTMDQMLDMMDMMHTMMMNMMRMMMQSNTMNSSSMTGGSSMGMTNGMK